MQATELHSVSTPPREAPHENWLRVIRMEVDVHLHEFFDEKRREMLEISPPTLELLHEVGGLTLRGGKRLRPAIAAAGYRCVFPGYGMERLVELSSSLELLQSYLLIHDDWMDGDEVRRGGPSVHASLGRSHGDAQLGNALGILAGDLASTYAWELFLKAPYPVQAWPEASRLFLSIQKQVYCGQQLDLTLDEDIPRMHALKTTSYSVRGPLLLGALLANATRLQLEALSDWAAPIGEAFQIRDDILGAMGVADDTGKPGLDIPHGKLTSVLSELRRSTQPADRGKVEALVGKADFTDDELADAQACLERLGVIGRLERRIDRLRDEALRAVDTGPFNPQGRGMLAELGDRLTLRRA